MGHCSCSPSVGAGNLFNVGIAWNSGVDLEGPAGLRARRLRGPAMSRVGHQTAPRPVPAIISGTAGRVLRHFDGGGGYSRRSTRSLSSPWPARPCSSRPARTALPGQQANRRMLAPLKPPAGCGASACTTRPSSVPMSRWPPGCRSTTSRTSTSRCAGGAAHRDLHFPRVAAPPGRRLVLRPLRRAPGHVLDLRRHARHHRHR